MIKIYGASDDLLEFEGDLYGEVGCYNSTKDEPIHVKVSDGTEFIAYYNEDGIWKIEIIEASTLFISLDKCERETDNCYSDILTLDEWDKVTAKYKCKHSDSWEKVK